MKTAKLFQNGQSQAVRLPKSCRFRGTEVFVHRMGNAVVLLPKDDPWSPLVDSLKEFSDDFLSGRVQPDQSPRDPLD